jgi:hypothetical protein
MERRDLAAVGALLHESFRTAALEHGAPPPWRDATEATALAELYLGEPEGAVVAEGGGAIAGCGFVRRRGEIATLGPIAAAVRGRGTGGKLLDELIATAEGWGVASMRLYQDGWNPASFAMYAGRSFAAVDTVAAVERAAGAPPRLDSSRGLEVAAMRTSDLEEVAALDRRLTGLERAADLAALVRLVARRRGAIVGYGGVAGNALGPVVALDVADLGALVARLLPEIPGAATGRLSTAAPTAMLAMLALGFRVTAVGTVMVRGVAPPARPPQLYGIRPEIL